LSAFVASSYGSQQKLNTALADALEGLRVEVIQGTSDEAKGLLRHVERDIKAHHSPDLFHFQHDAGGSWVNWPTRSICPSAPASASPRLND